MLVRGPRISYNKKVSVMEKRANDKNKSGKE